MKRIFASRKVRLRVFACLELVLLLSLAINTDLQFSVNSNNDQKASIVHQLASLPLAFEPNRGQIDSSVQYLVHHGKAATYFSGADTTTVIGKDILTMSLNNANASKFTGTDQLTSTTNYLIGTDQSKWHSNIPNYQQLITKNIYSGIDLRYYGNNSQLEHDFIVSPNADYKQIAFHFVGQKELSLDVNGNLVLGLNNSKMTLNAPVTYQLMNSTTGETKHSIPSQFELNDNIVTIALNADYDHSQPLIIDPVLAYSTYLGGTGTDYAYNIAVDTSGNAYVSGTADSTDFPLVGPYQGVNGGGYDTFVTKLNATGTALEYSTYIGGIANDISYGIAIDSSNNAYISGITDSTDFPTVGPYQGSNNGNGDGFVAELDSTGSNLVYSTYLGGTGSDTAYGIAVDASGNAFLSGYTDSTDFPTALPYQGSNNGIGDAFITELDSTGSNLLYSTYLGGTADDGAVSIAINTSGNAYVTGYTDSTDFPTASPQQGASGGSRDAFAATLDATGTTLIYSTYLGGTGNDQGLDIAVDTSNNSYISGTTDSTDFPTASPLQGSNAGSNDSFITKFNSTGSNLVYSTYLGGTGYDGAVSIAIDTNNNAYVSGTTSSADFPTLSPYQASNGGAGDTFVTRLNAAGTIILYSTYFGGTGDDSVYGIAVDASNSVYLAGLTTSTDLPVTLSYQNFNAGGYEAFITKFSTSGNLLVQVAEILTFSISSTTCDLGHFSSSQTKFCNHTISASTNAANGYTISYLPTTTLTNGIHTVDAMASQTASVLGIEQFGLNLKANTAVGSLTATDFGADESGGSGFVMTGYELADQFQFNTGGGDVAQSAIASDPTTFTASFIANIAPSSEAGGYSTPVTYNITPSY